MRTNVVIKILICIQLMFICLTLFFVHNKRQIKINNNINTSIIDKKNIQESSNEELKNYYDFNNTPVITETTKIYPPLKKSVIYTNNTDGLTDTKEYSIQKDKKTFRIITLGDSFTYGLHVNTKDNWTEILENKLNNKSICKNIDKFEVINLAVTGHDIQYQVERYKRKGQKYNPDLIVWMQTDNNRIVELERNGQFQCWDKYPDRNSSLLSDCIKNNRENQILSKMSPIEIINFQKNNLLKIFNFYEGNIFFIDYFNSHDKIISGVKKISTHSNMYNRIKKENNLADIVFPDQHPNEKGHVVIADIIFEQLFKTNQIPCEQISQ